MPQDPSEGFSVVPVPTAEGLPRLRLIGELDISAESRFLEAIAAAGPEVWLDCSELSFLDSSGLRAILLAGRTRRLHVTRPSAAVRRVLVITGLEHMIDADTEPGSVPSAPQQGRPSPQ